RQVRARLQGQRLDPAPGRARARPDRRQRDRRRRQPHRQRTARTRRPGRRPRRPAPDRQPSRTRNHHHRRNPMRVGIADDSALLRQGVARLLAEAGIEVCGEAGDAQQLLWLVEQERPDVAVVDIRMPPTNTDEGLVAAAEIGERFPHTGVLVLSQYIEPSYALRLVESDEGRRGYLLKDRVMDADELIGAL